MFDRDDGSGPFWPGLVQFLRPRGSLRLQGHLCWIFAVILIDIVSALSIRQLTISLTPLRCRGAYFTLL